MVSKEMKRNFLIGIIIGTLIFSRTYASSGLLPALVDAGVTVIGALTSLWLFEKIFKEKKINLKVISVLMLLLMFTFSIFILPSMLFSYIPSVTTTTSFPKLYISTPTITLTTITLPRITYAEEIPECINITDKFMKDLCHASIAFNKSDILICGKIEDEYIREDCEWDVLYLRPYEGDIPPNDAEIIEINSGSYSKEYQGYMFKIEHIIYSGEYEPIAIALQVKEPNRLETESKCVKNYMTLIDDNTEIGFIKAYWEGLVEYAEIWLRQKDIAKTTIETTTVTTITSIIKRKIDINSDDWTTYDGYNFKINHSIFSGDYECVGVVVEIEKPDEIIVQRQVTVTEEGAVVDHFGIRFIECASEGIVLTAAVEIYEND
ncbi:MAG: hypothetical protein B6U72_06225 [Candidatus Altiarchaeales archaeon ex4484_2]|nr:MAG: hypothetical protein B6U72_06225 [Candidatus Altiarchaeales archaeon ex4484_2]